MAKNKDLVRSINSSFELKCLDLLVKSYGSAITEHLILNDWEEESISAHIVKHMRKFKSDLIVNYEVPLVEEDVYNAIKRVRNSNRIDIFFQKSQWRKLEYLEYHIEAKNISSVEWKKSNGSKVNASQQQTEYITKGVDRFITGHFKEKNGCMLGYLVNGRLDEVLAKINAKIIVQKSNAETITLKAFIFNNYQIFESIHSDKVIKHLFFDFVN